MKLLLVEDEPILSKSIARGLKKRGYMVDCAYDGEEALELYAVNEYDLMILDLNLPKLDGMEVLRQVRQEDDAMRILISICPHGGGRQD
ncbi:MAG: response regulator [[Clostridium] scindens]